MINLSNSFDSSQNRSTCFVDKVINLCRYINVSKGLGEKGKRNLREVCPKVRVEEAL